MSKRQVPTSGNASLDASHPFLPLEETMRSNAADIESTLDEIPKNYGYGYDNDYDYDYDYDYDSTTSKKNDDGPAKLKVSSRRNNSGSSSEIDPTIESSENNNNNDDNDKNHATFALAVNSLSLSLSRPVSFCQKRKLPDGKKIAWGVVGCFFVFILWECFFVEPQDRLIQPDFSDKFLTWVQSHPTLGLGAILIVIAAAVVSLVPIGTPLTLGCGYIYRGVYGWKMGLFVSTLVSMAGSTLGAVTCFLLGRYLMRDTVKRWVRNYPMFDAIDVAVSEQGLKIMAMLYLTPVLPLGLVSYMCGTTAMDLYSFVVAKIASLPLYLMYTFMGASAHSFIKGGKNNNSGNGNGNGNGSSDLGKSLTEEANKLEENQYMILAGLVLSAVMIGLITRKIKKELMKILDEQKKEKVDESTSPLLENDDADDKTIEMGLTARRKTNTKVSQK